MVKKIFLSLTMFILFSCSYKINEYGKRRYKSYVMKTYPNKFMMVDSTNIYEGYYKLTRPDFNGNKILAGELRKNFLIFYENGRIGRFLDFNEKDFDFNPKKAEMGFYGKIYEKCFIKFNIEYPYGHKISQAEILFLDKDSLITFTKPSSTTSGFNLKFIKVNNQNLKLDKTPDW